MSYCTIQKIYRRSTRKRNISKRKKLIFLQVKNLSLQKNEPRKHQK